MLQEKDDFNASRNKEGRWEGSWTYTSTISLFPQIRPRLGDSCTRAGFEFLKVNGISVKSIGGGLCEATIKYDDGEDDDGEGGEDPGDSEKFSTQIVSIKGTKYEPILSSWELRNKDGTSKLDEDQANILSWWVSGKLVLCADNKLRPKKFDKRSTISYDIPEAGSITASIIAGYRRIPVPTLNVRKTYKTKRPDASKIGQVARVMDTLEDYDYKDDKGFVVNWMLVNYTVKKIGKREYDCMEEYALSGRGGYNKEIYNS